MSKFDVTNDNIEDNGDKNGTIPTWWTMLYKTGGSRNVGMDAPVIEAGYP